MDICQILCLSQDGYPIPSCKSKTDTFTRIGLRERIYHILEVRDQDQALVNQAKQHLNLDGCLSREVGDEQKTIQLFRNLLAESKKQCDWRCCGTAMEGEMEEVQCLGEAQHPTSTGKAQRLTLTPSANPTNAAAAAEARRRNVSNDTLYNRFARQFVVCF